MSELIDREATVKQICKIGEMLCGRARDVTISVALFVQDDKSAFPTVERPHGEWIDHSDEGYVECPFCDHATTCDDNIEELHYCFFCGAELRKEGEKNESDHL